jgi:hypothetical protein
MVEVIFWLSALLFCSIMANVFMAFTIKQMRWLNDHTLNLHKETLARFHDLFNAKIGDKIGGKFSN